MPVEGAEAGLQADDLTSEHSRFTLSSCDLIFLLDISRRLLPKDCVSDNCTQTFELLSKHEGRGEKLKREIQEATFICSSLI